MSQRKVMVRLRPIAAGEPFVEGDTHVMVPARLRVLAAVDWRVTMKTRINKRSGRTPAQPESTREEVQTYVYFVPTKLDFNFPSVKPATTARSLVKRRVVDEETATQPAESAQEVPNLPKKSVARHTF